MQKTATILLVEDNPADVDLTLECFERGRLAVNINVARDGAEALRYLRRQNEHAEAPRPELVFLDLNLPKKSGLEVLEEIKQDPAFASIPVIVLTSSKAETDVIASYQAHANCYIVKPIDFHKFVEVITMLGEFWLKVARLPQAMSTGGDDEPT